MSTGRNQLDKDMNKAEIKGNICKVRDLREWESPSIWDRRWRRMQEARCGIKDRDYIWKRDRETYRERYVTK